MKHKFIAKRYWKDQQTAMGKSDEMAKTFDDVINLSLGDPDLITDDIIIDGAFADAKAGHTKYTDFRGDSELRTEICRFYQEEYGMEVRDEEVFVCASASLGMYLSLEAIVDDGDEVILQAPFFTPYPQQVELARGIPVELATYEDEDFQINIERLESLIILNSFSKNFTMTGWRVGNIIAPDYIIKTIQQVNENVVFTTPSISQRAAIHALRHRHEIQPAMVSEYRRRMFYAAERVNGIRGLSVLYPPKGSFYLFVNIKETGLSSAAAAEKILQDAHVLTLPGPAFGACGEGYVRIACTVGVDLLCEAFDRIEKVQW